MFGECLIIPRMQAIKPKIIFCVDGENIPTNIGTEI